jgi:uncharacterized protein YjbJ (UPF0337 family)
MGIGENIKGTIKEKAGEAFGDENLREEGDAQQTKGAEQAKETEERVKAKAHEEEAESLREQQNRLEH